MPSKIRHGFLISLVVMSLIVISFNTSYTETATYIYDELNRLIGVIYEDGTGVFYTYDASGNRITLASYPDTVPPTGTITINSGAAVTYNPAVTLTLTCSDNVGCSQMQFSNDDVTYSTPEAYGTTKSWTLSPGYGTKTVYAKFKDVAGNWSTAYSDTIDLIMDSYTKSLLHMNGTDGSTTFTDSAAGGTHTWTAHGNVQIDTAQSKFGGASGLFDGTGDYITTGDHADFAMGSGDFTIDAWARKNGGDGTQIHVLGKSNSTGGNADFWIRVTSTNMLQGGFYDGSAYQFAQHTTALTVDSTWHHVALIRVGNNLYVALDGVLSTAKDVTGKSMADSAYTVAVGRMGEYNTQWWNGWIDEVRISKGIARWTSNFTPPTGEY